MVPRPPQPPLTFCLASPWSPHRASPAAPPPSWPARCAGAGNTPRPWQAPGETPSGLTRWVRGTRTPFSGRLGDRSPPKQGAAPGQPRLTVSSCIFSSSRAVFLLREISLSLLLWASEWGKAFGDGGGRSGGTAEHGAREHPQRFAARSPKILSTIGLLGQPCSPQHPTYSHRGFGKGAGSHGGTRGGRGVVWGGLTPPSGCCR